MIYYLACLSKDNASKAYLLNQQDTTSKQLHENEVGSLPRRIDAALSGFDPNLSQIIRQMVYSDPNSRGFLG